jgi:hypothetical protein
MSVSRLGKKVAGVVVDAAAAAVDVWRRDGSSGSAPPIAATSSSVRCDDRVGDFRRIESRAGAPMTNEDQWSISISSSSNLEQCRYDTALALELMNEIQSRRHRQKYYWASRQNHILKIAV